MGRVVCVGVCVLYCMCIQAFVLASEVWCEGEPNVMLCTAMTDCTLSQLSCVGTGTHNNDYLYD